MNRYERAWIVFGVVLAVAFIAIAGFFGFSSGLQPPTHVETIDPAKLSEDPRFSSPRVEEVVPGEEYNVYIVARMWTFIPNTVEIPKGARVNFYIASPDVVHGFHIIGTGVQTMVIPGYVTVISARFDQSGEFLIICNEYCGSGHHLMKAKLVVREV